MWLWYLDRGSGIVAYAALWLAAFAGILYNARGFGAFHRAAKVLHIPASILALVTLALHALVGTIDAWLVFSGSVPHPAFSDMHLTLGALIGAAALLLIVTATLGFLDAKRFQRPWDPRTVHLLAYAGFGFATIHAVAIGTDLWNAARPALIAGTIFLVFVLALRAFGAPKKGDDATREHVIPE